MRRATADDRCWLAMVAAILGIACLAALSFAPHAEAGARTPDVASRLSPWPSGGTALAEAPSGILSTADEMPACAYDASITVRATADVGRPAGAAFSQACAGEDGAVVPAVVVDDATTTPVVSFVTPRALPQSSLPSPSQAADLVRGANPVGSALKTDIYHRSATWAVDDIASSGSVYRFVGQDGVPVTLIQAPGELNGIGGRFEWIVDAAGNLTHQMFVKGGSINGVPITP